MKTVLTKTCMVESPPFGGPLMLDVRPLTLCIHLIGGGLRSNYSMQQKRRPLI